ncbi:MAG: sarcosine oxidase subunit gamma [Alphaproteobacteria bacterium]
MAEGPVRRGALAHVAALRGEGFRMEPGSEGSMLLLRGAPDETFLAGTAAALGVPPPVTPNTAAIGASATVLWLAPDEWLVVAADMPSEALSRSLAGLHAAVVDVSDAFAAIRMSGTRVPDILAAGCSLDLHPRVFSGVGRTLLGKADVLLHGIGDAGTIVFDVYVARSYADYLWRWLRSAASG